MKTGKNSFATGVNDTCGHQYISTAYIDAGSEGVKYYFVILSLLVQMSIFVSFLICFEHRHQNVE